jgi:two-component system response regulator HydG
VPDVGFTLIVDDDATHGRMLVEALSEAGWGARSANGVYEAMECVRTGRHTLVVSDIRMDDGDGFDLLAAIRQDGGSLPVILMSSFGTEATSRKALAAGAFAYLPKPFSVDDLLALVTRAHGA